MNVLNVIEVKGRGTIAVISRETWPHDGVRQGGTVEGSDGRRWKIAGVERASTTMYPSSLVGDVGLILEGEGQPKIGKPLVVIDENAGDALWISREHARLIAHILRTVRIWRKVEGCSMSPGLEKLAEHDARLEATNDEALINKLKALGFGELVDNRATT